jgi:CheY-like chemotaxis protein
MNAFHDRPPVVLVVDADPFSLTGIAAVLNLSGYECHMAQDSVAALRAAESLQLDLVVCDVDLKGTSGVELCHHIRRVRTCEALPFVFISDDARHDVLRMTRDMGSVYYVRKPLDPEVLLELVEKAVWMPHLVTARVEQAQTSHPHCPAIVESHRSPKTAIASGRSRTGNP